MTKTELGKALSCALTERYREALVDEGDYWPMFNDVLNLLGLITLVESGDNKWIVTFGDAIIGHAVKEDDNVTCNLGKFNTSMLSDIVRSMITNNAQ